jgi:hypothetical protein
MRLWTLLHVDWLYQLDITRKDRRMKCYYAHSTDSYDTNQEKDDVEALERIGFEVVNPNRPGNDEAYRKFGMQFFYDMLLSVDCLAFRSLSDGKITAGVGGEVEAAMTSGKPVFELTDMARLRGRILSVEETRAYLKEATKAKSTGHHQG